MFFRQLIDADLGCASYVIADAGEAIVVDPAIAIDQYLELAYRHRFGIAHIVETHTHADHVSGNRRLAELTGAQIHVSAGVAPAFACRPLRPGDSIAVGSAVLTARATPGHRPEHLALVLSDRGRDAAPLALLTRRRAARGRGRPPRPGRRSAPGGRARCTARCEASTISTTAVEVWPGHIGGSLCGGANLSQKPSSTLGYERRANPYLTIRDERSFVDRLDRLAPAATAAGRAGRRPQPDAPSCPACTSLRVLGDAELGGPAGRGRRRGRRAHGGGVRRGPPRRRPQPAAPVRLDRHARRVAARCRALDRDLRRERGGRRAARTGCWRPSGLFGVTGIAGGWPDSWRARRPARADRQRRSIPSPRPAASSGASSACSTCAIRASGSTWRCRARSSARSGSSPAGSPSDRRPSRSCARPAAAPSSPRARCAPASRSRSCASTAASPTCWRRWSGSPRRSAVSPPPSALITRSRDRLRAVRRKRPREGTTR